MEFKKINERVLKVNITNSEVEEIVGVGRDVYNNIQFIIDRLMDDLEDEVDFEINGYVMTQISRSEKGDMTVFLIVVYADELSNKVYLSDTDCNCPNCLTKRMMADIVQQSGLDPELVLFGEEDEDDYEEDDYGLEEIKDFFAVFRDIEDVIKISHRLSDEEYVQSKLYYYQNRYYLILTIDTYDEDLINKSVLLMQEYGNKPKVTLAMLEEYGKVIFEDEAIEGITYHFKL